MNLVIKPSRKKKYKKAEQANKHKFKALNSINVQDKVLFKKCKPIITLLEH